MGRSYLKLHQGGAFFVTRTKRGMDARCMYPTTLPPLFFLEKVALLSRRLYDFKDRLSLAFEVNRTAAIPEIGVLLPDQ